MPKTILAPAVVLILGLTGCASGSGELGSGRDLRRSMEEARMLEASAQWRAAADAYAVIAEQYPGSDYYGAAVRKAALLYAHPSLPEPGDTAAVRWLRRYLALPLPAGERESAQTIMGLLEGLRAARRERDLEKTAADSTTAQLRRQSAAHGRRLQELQTQLDKALDELQRLKEIEIKTSRGRRSR